MPRRKFNLHPSPPPTPISEKKLLGGFVDGVLGGGEGELCTQQASVKYLACNIRFPVTLKRRHLSQDIKYA